MTYEEKCNIAIREIETAKLWKSNYNPLLVKVFEMLGFKVIPPYYNSFFNNALITGIDFSLCWGIFMYILAWNTQNMQATVILSVVLFTGIIFALAMASYYTYSFKKYKLTPWHEIKNA
jgi:Family of unknown function (DUF6404)